MSSQNQPRYPYRPLDADHEIRVLVLQPAAEYEDPLVGDLVNYPIWEFGMETGPASYEAVSYCWGSLEPSLSLNCAEVDLPITPNVDSLLRHLRRNTSARSLWVDAICINQSDIREKEKQVRQMGTVYSHADQVHVWLGDAQKTDEIPTTFAILKEMALMERYANGLILSRHKIARLTAFLSRPWFRRRWVLQEVALSHAVTIRCGSHRLSWNWVRPGMEVLHAEFSNKRGMLPLEAIHSLENSSNLRPGTESILELLFRYHSSECADPRDRLFSLYSMISDESRELLDPHVRCPVDYSYDWIFIYELFAHAVIKAGLVYDLLAHVATFGSLWQQNTEWPSWIPSWNKERFARRRFSAAFAITQEGEFPKVVSRKHVPVLSMDGYLHSTKTPADFSSYVKASEDDSMMSQLASVLSLLTPVDYKIGRTGFWLWDAQEPLVNLLLNAIQDVQQFYHSYEINYESIFEDLDAQLTSVFPNQEKAPLDLLRVALMSEFGLFLSRRLRYNKEALYQEVNTIMEGYRIVYIQDDLGMTPVIIPPAFEPGDKIFRPGGVDFKPPCFAFVLRPCQSLDLRECFRLVGHCITVVRTTTAPDYLRFPQEIRNVVLI